jgi:Dolichyl-phosphate-mannose-protein mannosyltransferase
MSEEPQENIKPFVQMRWFVILLLSIHASLLTWSATKHSPNLNEPAHLVAGVSHWKFSRFELYRVNPPLIRMVAAIPILFSDATFDWSGFQDSPGARPVFDIGKQFINSNGEKSIWYFIIARWTCIPFSILGGYICYLWAKELFGPIAGLFSLTLWCFSPNILAHGQFITPAAGSTALGITAAYFFWKWLRHPGWKFAVIAGITLGLAELTKSTWIILFGLWPLIWILWFTMQKESKKTGWKKQLSQLGCVLLIGLYLLNLGYGFEGSFTKLKNFQFVSNFLTENRSTEIEEREMKTNRFADSWLGKVPLPFPKNYILGIDIQKKDFENFGRESYLRGEFQVKGWWYYYLYALAIKVPVGFWIIFFLANLHSLVSKSTNTASWRDGLMLAVPSITILILVSSQTGFSHHMRYVLPIFPFAFIWMGQSALWIAKRGELATIITCSSLIWAVGSSLWLYPHSLSYFNEIIGGPMHGHNHLINSNIDWGQDLVLLKDWIEDHPEAKNLQLCYYGHLDPKDLGFDNPLPPINKKREPNFKPPSGWYAISINYLRGYGWKQPKDGFSYFQNYKPVATVGYSIYIYHVIPEN